MDGGTTSDTSRERLLAAGLELVAAHGYKGATTRAIAERSGVAEVTLFRLFETKHKLIAAGFAALTEGVDDVLRDPTGDVEADLLSAAQGFHRLVNSRRAVLVPLLAELRRVPELEPAVRDLQRAIIQRFVGLLGHYREIGDLVDDEVETQALAFVAPMMASARAAELLGKDVELDPQEHVARFLHGRRAAASP